MARKKVSLLLIAILLLGGVVGVYLGNQRAQAAPSQPLEFDHSAHVENGVQCLYCHPGALRGPSAGLPSVAKCMGCHAQIEPDTPALQELARYAEEGKTIEWVPVAMQPDFVYFSHYPHVASGLNCEDCHGDVGSMTVARPQRGQDMGWCLSCHKKMAPERFVRLSDCFTCHK